MICSRELGFDHVLYGFMTDYKHLGMNHHKPTKGPSERTTNELGRLSVAFGNPVALQVLIFLINGRSSGFYRWVGTLVAYFGPYFGGIFPEP